METRFNRNMTWSKQEILIQFWHLFAFLMIMYNQRIGVIDFLTHQTYFYFLSRVSSSVVLPTQRQNFDHVW
jgi:hypothetical protein